MKSEDIRFNVGDIVYSLKGKNRITNNVAVLEQRVEAVMLEVDTDDGSIAEISYILTDDLGKDRSTKAKAVFATLEEALGVAKNDEDLNSPRSE